MLHMGLFTDSKKEMRFLSCNFCLKGRLGESAQIKTMLQFGRVHQSVRTNPGLSFTPKEQGVMVKLGRIATGVFGAWHSHVRAKWCYEYKISRGGVIKVTRDLMGPMRKDDTIRCL
jgi:hypothetical protein